MSVLILMALGWMALTGALAHLNLLSDFSRNNPAIGWLILIAFGVSTAVSVSPLCAGLARTAPIAWLIGLQSFRLAVELLLHRAYLAGLVPAQMTWSGRNFDILTGLTALPLAYLAATGRLPRWAAILWNLLGFVLLLNLMTLMILSTPTVFRLFPNDPSAAFIARFPAIWLPTVLFPAAWAGHLLLFRRLQS